VAAPDKRSDAALPPPPGSPRAEAAGPGQVKTNANAPPETSVDTGRSAGDSEMYEEEEQESSATLKEEAPEEEPVAAPDYPDEQLQFLREALNELGSTVQQLKNKQDEARILEQASPSMSRSTGLLLAQPQSPLPIALDEGPLCALRRRFDVQSRETQQEIFEIQKELMILRQAQARLPAVTEKLGDGRPPGGRRLRAAACPGPPRRHTAVRPFS
jgi:hypothetical protein